jgi:hypothetical protein
MLLVDKVLGGKCRVPEAGQAKLVRPRATPVDVHGGITAEGDTRKETGSLVFFGGDIRYCKEVLVGEDWGGGDFAEGCSDPMGFEPDMSLTRVDGV